MAFLAEHTQTLTVTYFDKKLCLILFAPKNLHSSRAQHVSEDPEQASQRAPL